MRPYDITGTIDTVGNAQSIWDARDEDYDEHGAYMTPFAIGLRITTPSKNKGYITFGGKKVNGAQTKSFQGFPYLAPGRSFCWDFPESVDLRFLWYDGTVATDAIAVAYFGEPLTERLS